MGKTPGHKKTSLESKAPAEARTLVGVLSDLTRRGFTEQFRLVDGKLRGLDGGQSFPAHQVRVAEYYRFEGVSDPDDMAILYALETSTGVRGTLSDAFGVYADPAVGAFMNRVRRAPGAGK